MSRVGNLPISVPSGITVAQNGQEVTVKGPKGELVVVLHPNISMTIAGAELFFSRPNDEKQNKALHGLSRSLVNNMVIGVSEGYMKRLEVKGVGYRFSVSGNKLTLHLGYSHSIDYIVPDGIEVKADEESKNVMIISGIDKQLVGEVSAQIRSYRKPEPYKGKGIRYEDERVVIKQGKAAAK
jgi:large subunit ribosomal protein L6